MKVNAIRQEEILCLRRHYDYERLKQMGFGPCAAAAWPFQTGPCSASVNACRSEEFNEIQLRCANSSQERSLEVRSPPRWPRF